MDHETWEKDALSWTIETLADDDTITSVLITVANALDNVHDMNVRTDVFKTCAQRIRSIIQEKAGVDIAKYL